MAATEQFSYPSSFRSSDLTGRRVNAPSPVDILLGRGKPFHNHNGNQRMLEIVDEHRPRYLKADRKDKHVIIEHILSAIRAYGGRFLSRVDYENYWVEVSHAIAYRKVGHAFRSKARKKTAKKRLGSGVILPSLPGEEGAQSSMMMNKMQGGLPPSVLGSKLAASSAFGRPGSQRNSSQQLLMNSKNPLLARPLMNSLATGVDSLRPPMGLLGRLPTAPSLETQLLLNQSAGLGGGRLAAVNEMLMAYDDLALLNAQARRSQMMESFLLRK